MTKSTQQMNKWSGEFGQTYTDRNTFEFDEFENLHRERFGITRSEINDDFVGELTRNIRILEVGSNVGTQLLCLQNMGFENLYGIELQSYAVEASKQNTKNINIIQGSAFDIPFKDNYFDLVFTSGVLIHISPDDLGDALKEIVRVSKSHIWGFEYFAETMQTINYRGNENLLWKADYAAEYQKRFSNLKLIKEEKFPYKNEEGCVDSMFLLKKESV